MNSNMKSRYRLFRRGWGVYYCEDTHTGKQLSLATSHKVEAQRLVHAKNEGEQHPAFSLQLARVYWKAGDPCTWRIRNHSTRGRSCHSFPGWHGAGV